MKNTIIAFAVIGVIVIGIIAWKVMGGPKVVAYIAHDKIFSEEIVARFEKETGIKVEVKYDTESDKTVGHVNRLREEKTNPKCDVHWSNEPMHTVNLAREGIYESYKSKIADKFPDTFIGKDNMWIGFAARSRVIAINTNTKYPFEIKSIHDLLRPELKGQTCIANPRAGSTMTHMAALYTAWGEAKFTKWVADLLANDVQILNSNGKTCDAVATGALMAGLTDTDDVIERREERKLPVDAVFADKDGEGTLLFPNTLAIVKGAPNPENARIFYEWVLALELDLCKSASAQIPLNRDIQVPANRWAIGDIKAMDVDWDKVADNLDKVRKILEGTLIK